MSSGDEQSEKETVPRFRPFTRESLAAMEARIAEEEARKAERERLKAEGIEPPAGAEGDHYHHHDEILDPDPMLEIGNPLPRTIVPDFPPELIATPIVDLDKYYQNQRTFMVISKGKDIFRFSATDSMWILTPFNPVRRIAIYILVHPAFSFLVIVTILTNCVLMTLPANDMDKSDSDKSEKIFTSIYTVESCIKVIARGFILEKFTYLRDPWNWLDFIVISLAYVTMGVDLGNLSALRTFRVLRALKTVAIVPGLKTIVGAVIESVKNLKDVIILTLFSLSVFALLGLQIYMGVLSQKCVLNGASNMTNEEFYNFTNTPDNWVPEKGTYRLCGNSTGARQCPANYTCHQGVGPNPDFGYTTFDTFPWALLSAFRLMTQDFWESLYQMVLATVGPWHMVFFVVIIFLGSFYLLNLILAIVAMSYDELQKKAELEEEAIAAEEAAIQEAADAAIAAEEANNKLSDQEDGPNGDSPDDGLIKTPSGSIISYELSAYDKDMRDLASIKSENGESSSERHSHANGKASLSLPGSPFNIRRPSRNSQQSVSWRNGRRYGDRKPLVLNTYKDAVEHLPYADDSKAVTPMSEDDGAIVIPVFYNTNLASKHSSYTSHLSRISYTSHVDVYNKGCTKEDQLRTRRMLQGLYFEDSPDSDECVITKQKPNVDSPFGDNHQQAVVDMKEIMVVSEILDQAARPSKESDREKEAEQKPKFKQRCVSCCLRYVDILCIWDCSPCWITFQKLVNFVVFDPFMELFITLCIVVNTLFMAMDHHNMNEFFVTFLENGNRFFSAIFAIEAALKLIALSPKNYFREGWNVFDFTIVMLSIVELMLAGVQGLSVLRSFRLLRVFKLAKSWPTLNLLISIMGKTMGALGNLTFVLGIIIFIFAVMGMQLFGKYYDENRHEFPNGEIPRWNFRDFMHSFMIVFRVLCGEWIESMWGCLRVAKWPCLPFFLATVVIGNLVVLNLFLALLLSSFGASNLSQAPADSADTKKLQEAIDRFARASQWVKDHIFKLLKSIRARITNQISDQTPSPGEEQFEDAATELVVVADGKVPLKDEFCKDITNLEVVIGDGVEIAIQGNGQAMQMRETNNSQQGMNCISLGGKVDLKGNKIKDFMEADNNRLDASLDHDRFSYLSDISPKEMVVTQIPKERSDLFFDTGEEKKDISKEDSVGEFREGEMEGEIHIEDDVDTDKIETATADVIIPEYPADCCPDDCYTRFAFCRGDDSDLWTKWTKARAKSFYIVEHKYFETLIISMILISSLALAAEDVNLKDRPILKEGLQYMDKVFTVLFLFEMLLKWLAFGFKTYFTNAWCWLDFVIVLVSVINLAAGFLGAGNIQAFKTMRTLRALRPLRALSRFQGMRVVVNALVQAIPAIFNVLLVCLIFWLIFAIMGVQFFNGRFYSCRDLDGTRMNASIVENRTACDAYNLTWENPKINFDNVLNAYLALFQVATFKGWTDIMDCAIDSTGENQQPEDEVNIYYYLYFVLFIIFGSFFTLNLFIGVIIDNFNEQKRKAGGSLEMFMTDDQKKYYNAMKKMGSKKPAKAIPRPRFKPQAIVFDLTTNKKFDMAIMIFICLNMTVMAMDHYQPTELFDAILERLNIFFIAIFTAECVLKVFALRQFYFKEPWNVFDFIIVILSILGIMLKDLIAKYFVSPTLLRVVRVVKVGRVLRLVKGARGIRTLLFALAMSLPALFNICLLLFLVMFIYAIFGMSFFMNVKHRAGINENFNFETFGQSIILLFQMSTSAGWDGVLAAIMEEEDCEDEGYGPDGTDGNCGNRNIAVAFLVSYLIISFLIIINMYIAVILENYSQATEDVQEGLTDDDYDMYYEIWQTVDPEGTQFIKYEALGDFLDSLEEPLQIPKPNKYKIISMDIQICEGDLIFCVDILDALTKDFFARKGRVIQESTEMEAVVPVEHEGIQAISSTFYREREIYCARIIQVAYRRFRGALGDGEPRQQQTAIVVESDGHMTKNGHKVIIHSRSPSIASRSTDV